MMKQKMICRFNEKTSERIKQLQKRREIARYQRKITTDIAVKIKYDTEIAAIDGKLNKFK